VGRFGPRPSGALAFCRTPPLKHAHAPRLLLALCLLVPLAPTHTQQPAPISTEALSTLQFRSIGPVVTDGRIHDVEARPGDPSTIYAATASGGLWKTTNKGTTWQSLFDDQPVSTFGDVALAPSTPTAVGAVWAGTGEQNNRQSTAWTARPSLGKSIGRPRIWPTRRP